MSNIRITISNKVKGNQKTWTRVKRVCSHCETTQCWIFVLSKVHALGFCLVSCLVFCLVPVFVLRLGSHLQPQLASSSVFSCFSLLHATLSGCISHFICFCLLVERGTDYCVSSCHGTCYVDQAYLAPDFSASASVGKYCHD